MTRLKPGLITSLIFCIAILTSCSGPDGSNSNSGANAATHPATESQNRGNDSLEELRSLVPISFEPEEVTWRTSETGGRKRLVAVLLLTSDGVRGLAARYGTAGTEIQMNVEQWFPVELMTMGETSGEMTIGGKAFPAAEFYRAPYSAGNIVFIPQTNYVILDLQSG